MQIKNRLFPYPILNHNKTVSNYGNNDFEFLFETEENDNYYILKKARFATECDSINRLYELGKIKIIFVIECSDTVYRRTYDLSKSPKDISLSKLDFLGKVQLSLFAVAKEDFIFNPLNVDEEYMGIDFEIEKDDILAANDGFTLNFIHQEQEDNLAQSIFSVILNHDMDDGSSYTVDYNIGKKICINISEKEYKNYKIIYNAPIYEEVFFNMLLVPALIEGLSQCKNVLLQDNYLDIEDLCDKFLWFRTILVGYKKLYGIDLTVEKFKDCSIASIAQDLLGKPFGKALTKLVQNVSNIESSDENE